MGTTIVKRWIVKIELAEIDQDGEPINWASGPFEERLASSMEEAVQMSEKLLAGQDSYFGDLVVGCEISDEPEQREIYV